MGPDESIQETDAGVLAENDSGVIKPGAAPFSDAGKTPGNQCPAFLIMGPQGQPRAPSQFSKDPEDGTQKAFFFLRCSHN